MTSTQLRRQGISWTPIDSSELDLHAVLPPTNYMVKANPATGALYFEELAPFPVPSKIYGDASQKADRILNTFMDRSASTGLLLAGDKGSGKSMLGKLLSTRAAERLQIPTIVINNPWVGEQFFQLIQTLEQPAIVMFDEFEKVYDKDDQQSILTLLDGSFPTKKLFILTCNDMYRIDEHMMNRPGRLFYSLRFTGLDSAFIREYSQDNLVDKSHVEGIVKIAAAFKSFSFDALQALVQEMNRYNETPRQAMEMLNISLDGQNDFVFDVKIVIKGIDVDVAADEETTQDSLTPAPKKVKRKTGAASITEATRSFERVMRELDRETNGNSGRTWNGNPLYSDPMEFGFQLPRALTPRGMAEQDRWMDVRASRANLVRTDVVAGIYEYNVRDVMITLTRQQIVAHNFHDLF